MSEKETWGEMITTVAAGDTIIHCTLNAEQLDTPFYSGFGGTDGAAFTAWSEKYVYFPVQYDGAEWVARVPRDPCDVATEHVGGG